MAHRNARLTVHGRRLIVTRVLEEGWRSSPLVFSFVPRCQGPLGSQKQI